MRWNPFHFVRFTVLPGGGSRDGILEVIYRLSQRLHRRLVFPGETKEQVRSARKRKYKNEWFSNIPKDE